MRYKIRFVWAITQMMLCNISFSNKTFFVALRPRPSKSIFRQLNKRDNTNHFNSFCRSKHCLDNWFGPFISWLVFIDSVSKQIINDYFFFMWSPHLVFWFFFVVLNLTQGLWEKYFQLVPSRETILNNLPQNQVGLQVRCLSDFLCQLRL